MATLNNTRISDTYFGLIKTIDNAAISATLKELSDGSGNATGLSINNAGDFKVNSVLEFGSLKDTGENIVISKFVDAADGIGNNNNDTSIPTSAAVVSYVAAQITAEDLDFRGDDSSVLGDVDLNSEAFIILGTANEIQTAVTAAGGNTIQIGLPNNVTITSDLSAVNLNSSSLLTTLNMRLKGDISILNKAGSGYAAFAQRDVSGSSALINLNNIGSIGASGTITAPTFSGQLSGTISSASTATTQSAGDNSTKVATTAYVDSLDAGSDLDFSGDSGTGAVVLNTETLAVTGTTNQIETTATGTGLNLKFPTGGVVLPNGSTATTQLSSDNSTKVATTAYVKGLDNASDLDITDGTTAGDVNLNTQSLSILGTAQQVTSTVSNQSVTLSLPSSINVNSASATILQNARDISLTGQATATISSFNGSSNVSGAVTLDNNSVTGKVLTGLAAPTATNITASDTILQAFGKAQSQINTLAGGLRFMGTWNATTNSPTLASGGGESASGTTTSTTANKLVDSSASFTNAVDGDRVVNQASGATATVDNVDSSTVLTLSADIMVSGQEYTIDNSPFITQGHYFVVSVGGTSSLNGLSNWAVGDWVIAGANNTWEKLDHTQVDGTGTTGNITKWESTNVIADSIMAESGSTISVTGSLSTSQLLSSGGNFAVNTNKFTANATTGNVVVAGTLNTGAITGTSANLTTSGTVLSLDRTGGATALVELKVGGTIEGYLGADSTKSLIVFNESAAEKLSVSNGGNLITTGTINSGAITSTGNISGSNLTASVRLFSGDGGNKTNPMIANGSDQDTGIFFPSANVMAFTAGDAEALRFTGANSTFAGNVGIGVTGLYSTDRALNLPGKGISFKNDVNGSNNNWSYIYNTATGSSSNLVFATGASLTSLTLSHSGAATFAGTIVSDNISVGLSDGNNSSISLTSNTGNWVFTNVQSSRNLVISDSDGTGTVMTIDTSGNLEIGSANDPYLSMISSGGNGYNQRFRIFGYADGGTYGGGFKLQTRDSSNVFNDSLLIDRSGNAIIKGKIESVKELVNINSANGLRSAGLESDNTGNIWLGTGTTAATINFVTGNSTNGNPSVNGVKRLTTNREGTDVYASYAGNTFPFRVGYLSGSTYTPTLTVKDNGRVFIGVSSGTTIQDTTLQLQADGASQNAGLMFINKGNTASFNDIAGIASFIESGSAKGNLQFWTRNSDGDNSDVASRMTIDSSGIVQINTNVAKTSTSTVEFGSFGQSNEATNYSALQMYTKGGASQADRKVFFQTIESGVANAGNIVLQPSGGNLGIGSDSPSSKLQVKGNICVNSESVSTAIAEIDKIEFKKSHPNGVSGYYTLGEIRSKTFGGYSGGLNFYTGRATTPGAYQSTFAMTIDNFGQVGIGQTDLPTDVYTATGGGYAVLGMGQSSFLTAYKADDSIELCQNTYLDTGGGNKGVIANVPGSRLTLVDGNFVFATLTTAGDKSQSANNVMQITAAGDVEIGSNPRTAKFQVATNNADYVASLVSLRTTGSDCYGFEVKYQNATPNGTGNHFAFFHDSTGEKCSFPSNGGIRNFQSNNINLSDRRLKENIIDTPKSLDVISKLKVRNYKLKDRSDEKINTGLIAQEVEEVCKELVNNDGIQTKNLDNSDNIKGIYNTDLMFMMLKAIQELKAEVDSLKKQCNCK